MDTFEHWEITFTLAAGCGEEDAMALRDWIEEDDRVSGAALSGHNDHPRGAVCECGFAGTDVTPEGMCGTCGRPLNQESVAWLAKEYGRLRVATERGAVA